MTPIDVVGDTGGFLEAVRAAVASLNTAVVSLSALVEVLIVGLCILIAVEVARGVMRR
jgi:hypothetical protein